MKTILKNIRTKIEIRNIIDNSGDAWYRVPLNFYRHFHRDGLIGLNGKSKITPSYVYVHKDDWDNLYSILQSDLRYECCIIKNLTRRLHAVCNSYAPFNSKWVTNFNDNFSQYIFRMANGHRIKIKNPGKLVFISGVRIEFVDLDNMNEIIRIPYSDLFHFLDPNYLQSMF